MSPKIYAIVVAYNRGEKIKETLASLLRQTVSITKIIVVDNSTDSRRQVRQKNQSRKIEILSLARNVGPGWARNIGLSQCLDADFVIFLDDDIVFDPQTVSQLLEVFRKKTDCVGAMPVIYFQNKKKRVWSAGSGINLVTGQTSFEVRQPDEEFAAVSAAASVLMARPEAIIKSGWYDPIYFFSYEDADFYFRLRQKNQGKIYVAKSARAYHDVPISDTKSYFRLALRSYYIARGRVIFLRRFGKNFPVNIFFIFLFCLYYFYLGIKLGFPLAGPRFLEGIIDGLKVVAKMNTETSRETKTKSQVQIGRIKRPIFLKDYSVTTW